VQLFVREPGAAEDIRRTLAEELPTRTAGFPTHFGPTEEKGTVVITETEIGPVDHRAEIVVLADYLRGGSGSIRSRGSPRPTGFRHRRSGCWS
jgi:hypothetical protein